jgi:hypothetical protein
MVVNICEDFSNLEHLSSAKAAKAEHRMFEQTIGQRCMHRFTIFNSFVACGHHLVNALAAEKGAMRLCVLELLRAAP